MDNHFHSALGTPTGHSPFTIIVLLDSFFEGVEEFVEFEELFVHVERGVLELLDFLGAVGENEGQGRVRRRWREQGDAIATFTNGWRASLECKVNNTSTAVQYPHP